MVNINQERLTPCKCSDPKMALGKPNRLLKIINSGLKVMLIFPWKFFLYNAINWPSIKIRTLIRHVLKNPVQIHNDVIKFLVQSKSAKGQ